MSNIHSILPLLDDNSWRWDRNTITRDTVRPGSSRDLINSPKYPGFIYFGVITVVGQKGPDSQVEVEFDNANTKRSLGRLYNAGLSGTEGISPGISRYDTENDIYVTRLSPTPPISYLDNAKISLHAPQDESVRVNAFGIKVDILDVDLFMESYENVVSGQAIQKISSLEDKLTKMNANLRAIGETLDAQLNAPDRGDGDEDIEYGDSFRGRLESLSSDIDELDEGWL